MFCNVDVFLRSWDENWGALFSRQDPHCSQKSCLRSPTVSSTHKSHVVKQHFFKKRYISMCWSYLAFSTKLEAKVQVFHHSSQSHAGGEDEPISPHPVHVLNPTSSLASLSLSTSHTERRRKSARKSGKQTNSKLSTVSNSWAATKGQRNLFSSTKIRKWCRLFFLLPRGEAKKHDKSRFF